MTTVPPAFKTLLSAVRRAEELDRDSARESRVVAYHIRYYVVSKAMKLKSGNDPDEANFLKEQLKLLEKSAPELKIADGEGRTLCVQQAMSLFDRADEIDRSGRADKGTAKLFYAAATIFDALEQFGDQDPEIVEKKKYAKWKAADILNAINSGLRPTPGGYGEQIQQDSSSEVIDLPPPSNQPQFAAAPAPAHVPPPVSNHLQFSQPVYTPAPAPAAIYHQPAVQSLPARMPAPSRGPVHTATDPRAKDAIELCHFAVASLNRNDIQSARDKLQEALRRLG